MAYPGVWGPVLSRQQAMAISFHLAPCRQHGLSQRCGRRDCCRLLRARGLLQTPFTPVSEAAGPAPPGATVSVSERPGSLEAGSEVTKAEICSFTSLPWAAGPVGPGPEFSSWRKATSSCVAAGIPVPQQQPSERAFSSVPGLGSWTGGSERLALLIRLSSRDAHQRR